MKKSLFVLCCMLCVGKLLFAQGIQFENGSFEEALAKAKMENKLLFVDVCTSWCGPCQRMSREVFSRDNVGRVYNEGFINYTLDAEEGNGPDVCRRYGVDAYPTFLFLDGEGKLIYKLVGYHDAKSFLAETDKVAVYAKYGGWDQVMEHVCASSGGVTFWKDYYEISSDDQEILRKYLNSMSDTELFQPLNGFLIQKAVYDRDLYLRVANGIVEGKGKSADFYLAFRYPFEGNVAEYLSRSIEEGNEVWFKELLALKNVIDRAVKVKFNDLNMAEGHRYMEASKDFLSLCFYYKNMNDDRMFEKLLVDYMDRLIVENPLDSIREKRQAKKEDEPMTKADTLLLELMSDKFKELQSEEWKNKSALWEYRMMANAIVDWTNYYWQITPSDKATRERCVKWLNYACAINPCNPEAPVNAAGLLVHLNHGNDALFHLEQAIAQQKKVKNDNIRQIRRLELMLNCVKKGKL